MAMKRLKAKKRAQAKRNSQSNGVSAQQEIPAKEEDSAKGQVQDTKNRWTKYQIATEFIAKMEPLSYPVTRDLEHEVLCDFNLDDACPVARYMPVIDCLQGTSLLLMQNCFAVELT